MNNIVYKMLGLLIAFSITMISCQKEVELNGARLSPKEIVVLEDAKPQKIYLYLYPTKSTNQDIRWETTSNAIITVTQNGEVSPVAEGEAYVVVYQNNRALDSCKVTVNPVIHVRSVSLSSNTLEITTTAPPKAITANIIPENATYPGVQWTSSDESVVTVSSGGLVSPVSIGTAIISATTDDGGFTDQCTVTVTEASVEIINLLANPGFETPDDKTTALPSPWIVMIATDLTVDYPQGPAYSPANRSDDAFWTTGAGATGGFGPHGGSYSGRLPAGGSTGLYQLVDVTPGATYNFSAWVVHFRTNVTNQGTIKEEQLRIKNADGSTTLESVNIGTLENMWMEVTGSVTIPDGVTKIRFQVSQHDEAVPLKSPGTLVDDCLFYKAP